MILTVTPNTGLDRVLFLGELQRNRRNVAECVESMGGKGCDVSLFLRELGEESVATGLAAGESGHRMEAILRSAGVTPDFVWTPGATRVNTVLIESETGGHTTICTESLEPDDNSLAALLTWVERWSASAHVIVLAGSLPKSWPSAVYTRLVRAARSGGRPVVVDASGDNLRHALDCRVAAVKPNRDELESVAGPLPDLNAIRKAAAQLQSWGADRVLATLGREGAMIVDGEGSWFSPALPVEVVNPAGAGDAATACLALGLARGWTAVETLRWAMAASAAVVSNRGTAELHQPQVIRLLDSVRIETC